MENSPSEQQDQLLLAQADAFLKLLIKRGIISDTALKDEMQKKTKRRKRAKSYHNTEVLLKNYRTLSWMLECFPGAVAEELEAPFEGVDELLEKLEFAKTFGKKKMERRLSSVEQTRLLLDRVNEALTVLKQKPGNGKRLYDVIYMTFITPEKLSNTELLYRLNLSCRQYYRYREEATSILSLRLWSSQDSTLDLWLELLSLIEEEEQ